MELSLKKIWVQKWTPYLIILLLLGVQIWVASRFLAGGNLSSGCDVLNHLRGQLVLFEKLANWADRGIWGTLYEALYGPDAGPYRWPRLTYLVSSIGTVFFGPRPMATILFTNAVFTLILFISLFKIGERLAAPKSGLLACVILSLCPGFIEFFRRYGLDFPLMSVCCLSFLLLLGTEGFRRRGASILFGLSCGLVLFTKLQGVFILLAPVCYAAFGGWKETKSRCEGSESAKAGSQTGGRRATALNMSLAAAFAGACALLLLYPHLEGMWRLIHLATQHQHVGSFTGGEGQDSAVAFYLSSLFLGLSPLIFVLALVAAMRIKKTFALWLVIIPPVLIFVLGFNVRWGRFLIPVYPFIALVVADLLLSVRRDQTPVWHFFRRENENKRQIARNEESFCGGVVELRRVRNLTNDAARCRLGRSQQEKVPNWSQRRRILVAVVLCLHLVQTALLIPNKGTRYLNLVQRMKAAGLSTGGFTIRLRSLTGVREHFNWFAGQLRSVVSGGDTVTIGILEDPDIGIDARSMLELLTRMRLPRARLIFIGSGANPQWFFDQLPRMHWVIGIGRKAELNFTALQRKYCDRSWTGKHYHYVNYRYDQPQATAGFNTLEKMTMIHRKNCPVGVHLFFMKKPIPEDMK